MPRVARRLQSSVSWLALGLAITAGPVLAAGQEVPSVFTEVPSTPTPTYREHTSTSPSDDGVTAWDMNADGSIVVGGVSFGEVPDDDQRTGQAAVWSPDDAQPNDLLFLPDSIVSPSSNHASALFSFHLSDGDAEEITYSTTAYDIAAGSLRIVGTADGFYTEGETHDSFDFQLPLYWDKSGSGWSSAKILPVPDLDEDINVGGANAISDNTVEHTDLEYIAGWTGWAQEFDGGGSERVDPSHINQVEATLWAPDHEGGWVPQRLGKLNDAEDDGPDDDGSMANDVNDLGQVVGWSGFFATYDDTRAGWGVDGPLGNWSPRPFVYDNDNDGMQKLSLIDSADEDFEYDFGEGRAISNAGNLAVGWVAAVIHGEGDFDGPPLAAAWTNDSSDWSENSLINLNKSLIVPDNLPDESGRRGSMAEAVDAGGHLIVGKALYDDDESLAVYWQLNDDMQVELGESVQGALQDAGVDLDNKDFPAGGNHRLTDATAVRVVDDEASGDPKSIVILGTGTGSYGSWIAKLGTFAAITTPVSIGTTLVTIDRGTKSMAARFGDLADNDYCARPVGTSVTETPLCYFVSGGTGGYANSTTAGGSIGTQFGIARYFDDENSAGVSGGLDGFAGGGPGDSTYDATSAVLGGYAAHMPQQGLQGRVAVSLGAIIDATFERVYANGGGSSTSTGNTSGAGFGAVAHIGYATPLDELTTLLPFAELQYGAIHLGAYTEHNGAFPGVFSAIDAQRLAATLGLDATRKLDDRTTIFGGVSLSGVYATGTGVNASIAGLPFSAGTSPLGYALLSGTVGASLQLDPVSALRGQVRASTNLGSYSSGGVLVSYSHSL